MKTLAQVIAEHRGHLTNESAGYGTCECRFAFKRWSDHAAHVAAAWRTERTITTEAELRALPEESVIRDSEKDLVQFSAGRWTVLEPYPLELDPGGQAKYLPAQVVYLPGDEETP